MNPQDNLRSIRMAKGLSTRNLGVMAGLPQSTISKLENGNRKLDRDILLKIAEALNVTINDFFTEEDDKPVNIKTAI